MSPVPVGSFMDPLNKGRARPRARSEICAYGDKFKRRKYAWNKTPKNLTTNISSAGLVSSVSAVWQHKVIRLTAADPKPAGHWSEFGLKRISCQVKLTPTNCLRRMRNSTYRSSVSRAGHGGFLSGYTACSDPPGEERQSVRSDRRREAWRRQKNRGDIMCESPETRAIGASVCSSAGSWTPSEPLWCMRSERCLQEREEAEGEETGGGRSSPARQI